MQSEDIEKKLERLSEAAVFAEPSDPKTLAKVSLCLSELADCVRENDRPEEAAILDAALRLLEERFSGGDEGQIEKALEVLGQTVSAIQSSLLEGEALDLATLPKELGLVDLEVKPSMVVDLPDYIDQAIFSEFLARQTGVLTEMEQLALALEQGEDPERMAELKRMIHTLKGEAALLGLRDVEQLCHATEDALAKRGVKALVDPLLEVKDWLGRTFDWYSSKGPAPEPVERVLSILESAGEPKPVDGTVPPKTLEVSSAEGPDMVSEIMDVRADFVSEAKGLLTSLAGCLSVIEQDPLDRESIHRAFKVLHRLKGASSFMGAQDVEELSMGLGQLMNLAMRGRLALNQVFMDLALESLEALRGSVRRVEEDAQGGGAQPGHELQELSARLRDLADGRVTSPPETSQPGPEKSAGTQMEESPRRIEAETEPMPIDKPAVRKGNDEPGAERRDEARPHAVEVREAIRVDAGRLDRLIDMIGELVVTESMVAHAPELLRISSPDVLRHIGQLDKITRELQEIGTSLRMIPVRQTFQKMARLVRDLARKAGKQVEFTMSGEETELDKTVVDRIGDPLVHLLRNAVDHGIEETSDERERRGKDRISRIELRAFHKGGNIHIEVEDDGRGLDRERILAKARQTGLISEGESLSDREAQSLIFEPGFSTAKAITDVSGRGVGLDVVKRSVESLRGKVEVRSVPGEGCLFNIQLPLTLAIIDGMVVRIADQRYIIPTLSVIRSIRPKGEEVLTILNRGEVMMMQGEVIPLIRVKRLFDILGGLEEVSEGIVVVVEDEGRRVGLIVDELLGQLQIVMKSISESMQKVPGVAGGAIMPDGRVGLIMDVGGLVQLGHTQAAAIEEVAHAGN